MKSNLIPLLVLISTVLGKLEPNQECQFCREGIKFLFDNLIDPEVLEGEQQYLVETVCNVLEDPSDCEIGINTWWNKIAIIIFNQDFAIEVCGMIVENCLNIRIWDCETCNSDLEAFADIMLDDQTALKIVTNLNGPEFCQDPALALDQEQIKECQNFVTSYIPSSLKALFSPRSFVAEDICYDLFNVCD